MEDFSRQNHNSTTKVNNAEKSKLAQNWKQDRHYELPHCDGGWAEGVSQEREIKSIGFAVADIGNALQWV